MDSHRGELLHDKRRFGASLRVYRAARQGVQSQERVLPVKVFILVFVLTCLLLLRKFPKRK